MDLSKKKKSLKRKHTAENPDLKTLPKAAKLTTSETELHGSVLQETASSSGVPDSTDLSRTSVKEERIVKSGLPVRICATLVQSGAADNISSDCALDLSKTSVGSCKSAKVKTKLDPTPDSSTSKEPSNAKKKSVSGDKVRKYTKALKGSQRKKPIESKQHRSVFSETVAESTFSSPVISEASKQSFDLVLETGITCNEPKKLCANELDALQLCENAEKFVIEQNESAKSKSDSVENSLPESAVSSGPTAEEFDYITQQLHIMNEARSRTPTNLDVTVTRTAGKKSSAINKHRIAAVKRAIRKSPRKARSPRSREVISNEIPSPSNSEWLTESGESDVNELMIDSSDEDLDIKLEENAAKNNLTAINVKNILHHVVTNEHVLDMVQNSLTEDSDRELRPAVYEPKMTRSKTKLGQMPEVFPWLASPAKNSGWSKSTILNLNFPEEEEDDDYEPEKDIMPTDSDADSVVSSFLSDFGSPCPSTPTTPRLPASLPSSGKARSPSKTSTSDHESPINRPPVNRNSAVRHLGKKFQDALGKVDEDDPEIVAHRTRSKVPLNDKSLLELEASFVAPDITPDMYDMMHYDDPLYSSFLTGLFDIPTYTEQPAPVKEVTDDETNDPEYNFLAEWEEPDEEDLRNDRGTRVPKKELNALFEELLVAYGDGPEEVDPPRPVVPRAPVNWKTPARPPKRTVITLTPSLTEQIHDQMLKHVQLLTQVFVLSTDVHQRKVLAMLYELKNLGDCVSHGGATAYHPANLLPAIDIVQQPISPSLTEVKKPTVIRKPVSRSKPSKKVKDGDQNEPLVGSEKSPVDPKSNPKSKGKSMSPCEIANMKALQKVYRDLPYVTKDLFSSHHNVFCFPQLLPTCLFFPEVLLRSQKLVWMPSEDNLIAFGLEQAGRKCHTYIHKHLLPCKSPNQIRIRIKNQVARKENNVIKTFVKERKLPDVKKTTELNNIEYMYPDWYKDFIEKPPVTKRERSHSICQGAEVNTELKRLLVTKIKPQPRRRRSNSAPPALYPSVPTHNDVNNIPTLSETLKMLLEKDSTENRPVDNNDGVQNTSLPVSLMQIEGKIHNVAVRPELLALTVVGHQSVPMQQQTADVRPCALTDTTGSVGDCDTVKPVGPSTWIPSIGQAPLITLDAVPSSLSRSPLLKTEDRQLSLVKTSAITCVNQSIIFSQVLSGSSLSFQTTSTMSSGLISSTGVSGLQPLTSDQLSSSAQGTPKQSQSAPNLQGSTKTRSAVEIIASVAPFLASSPDLNPISPEKEKSSLQTYQEKTPPRPQRAILYRRIMPSPQRSPAKVVLPYVQKALRKNSPRRKRLKRQAKAILPKGFVIKPEVISPVKKAASKVRNKAVRSRQMLHKLHKIFPKSPGHPAEKSDKDTAPQAQAVSKGKDGVDNTDEDAQSSDDAETLDSDSDQGEDGLGAGSHTSHSSRVRQEESHPSPTPEADSFDSQTEEDDADDSHLHELMQASSTIRSDVFPKRKGALKVRRSKAQRHKDSTLAMLDPDIVHTDPFRDDRDIAFAQAYLHSVQTALKDKPEQYGKFLKLLHDFGKNQGSPVQLYEDIRSLLGDHPELVEDFSGFLLPDQAVRCGCYMANRQYHRVRSFLRKLEIHFEKHSSHFQKIIRTFCQWKPDRSAQEIRSHLQPLLKGQRHLLEELSLFFEDERPPESHPQDFEEVDLCDSDADEDRFLDGFEEVELSDDANFYGTKRCECACHHTNTDIRFFNRRKHCNKCGLKVVGGKLYFRSTGNNLIPAKVIYHKSFWMDETRQGPDSPKSAIKAHVNNALNSSENTAKTNGHFDKDKDTPSVDTSKVTCLVRKRIKPITLSRSVSQSSGRFMSLDEVDETQTNSPWIKRIQARTEEISTQSKSAFTRVSQATVVSEKPVGSLKINPRRTLDQSSELNTGAMSLNPQVTTLVLNSSKAVRSLSPVEHCEKNTSAPASPFQNIQENTLPQRVSSPQNVSSPVFDSPHKPQTSLIPHFVPSPPKDSSSSVSQDILTKALKAALVTSSDCKLSDDNSSSAKFSQTNNTDTVQPNTQQSQDHCCEEVHANHKERFSATQERSDFQPVEVNVSGLSSKLTGMNSVGQEAVCGFGTERTLVDSPKPMLPTLTVQQGETTILGRNQGEIIEQGFQGGCSETRDQSDHSENPSSQSAADNQTKPKWSREEDKLILETCKQFGPFDNTFQALTSQILHKSKSEIQERFETLMKLLKSKQPVTEENQT